MLATAPGTAMAQVAPALPTNFDLQQIPAPTSDPLRIDFSKDPILRLSESSMPIEDFRAVVAAALRRHPGRLESVASEEEARAALAEARERLFPSGEVTISSYKTLSREFSNDPFNIIERSRPTERTDALLRVQQTVFDFGATSRRIAAAGARLRAASAGQESISSQLALRTIASWYDVVAYQALTEVSEEFAAMQGEFRAATEERIRQGASAEGDLARVESYIASADTRRAQLQRSLAQAEARFEELTGTMPLPAQPRAPRLVAGLGSREDAVSSARTGPAVRAAEAEAEAAKQDYAAARSDLFPNVTAGIDAGRYGVFENDRDYDVRASVTLRQRLFGGAIPRAEQVGARARSVEARADRIRQEAERDASIAWSDVEALEAELAALRESYIASRRSRDVLFERFRVARGTLFDVLEANDSYFETAVAYVQALSELDAARYVLLLRTGKLLDALDIDVEQLPGTEDGR
jgi:adhesin transport system outer membrane protein